MQGDSSIPNLSHAGVGGAGQLAPGRENSAEAKPIMRSPISWWRIADFGVLGLWMAIVIFTIQYHEKWADEAQAWLIARDLGLRTIWFHELRYEGSPGLWHTMLWIAQHVFHAPYSSISIIGAVCATAGVALMLFKAPFPRPLRWMLAFTYFMVYQYAVIARPYTLLPLLAFAAAYFFRDLQHPARMTAVLILLANLSVHGALLAACLGLGYFTETVKSWPTLAHRVRKLFACCVVAMLGAFFLLFLVLKPTADVEEFAPKKIETQLAESEKIVQPSIETKLRAVISGAFFDEPITSCLFLLLAGAWCYSRKKLITFALPVAMMLVLYAAIHGYSHHHGTVFIAAITGLWIAWPTTQEEQAFTKEQRWALQGIVGLLVCLFALNIWDAAVAIRHEYLYPYSGAEDAARYLKSVGAEEKGVFGYLYGMVGVEAYFDHNIEKNRPTAYFHHGMPLIGTMLDVDAVQSVAPEYVVFFTEQPQLMIDRISRPMDNLGYQLVHFSDGYLLYKRGVYVRQSYFIFRRSAH